MDWKLDLYTKIAPFVAPHAIVASNTSGLSITPARRGAARGDPAALLRHPLLQPAALHVAGRADPDAGHAARHPRSTRSLRDHRARQGRGAREGHAELHRQPGRRRRHAGGDEGGRAVRPDLRRGRRPDRQEARPRQLGHLPHRRRGGAGHDGACHQDAAGQPGTRSVERPVLRQLRDAAGAQRADREGDAGPEDGRRLLQEGRQGHPALRSGDGRATCRAVAWPTRWSRAS